MPEKSQSLLKKYLSNISYGKLWPPFHDYTLFVFGSGYNTEKYFNKNIYDKPGDYSILIAHDGDSSVTCLPEEAPVGYGKEVFKKHLREPLLVKKFVRNFYADFEKVDKVYKKYIYAVIEKTDTRILCKILGETFDMVWLANAWAHFSVYFDKNICWEVLQEQKSTVTQKELDVLWEQAVIPVFKSFDKEQEYQVLKLIASGKNLEDHAEDFQYFYASYHDVKSLNETKIRLRKTFGHIKTKVAAQKLIQKMEKEEKDAVQKYQKWKAKLPNNQQLIVDYCQIVMKIRDNRKNFFNKMIAVNWRIGEKILQEAGLDKNLVAYTLPFQELVKGVAFVKKRGKEIERRKNGYVALIPWKGKVKMAYDNTKKAKHDIEEYYIQKEAKSQTGEIRGQIGNKGIIRGIVRIVLNVNRADHLKKGDILVAGMTRPEYVPLMKKASAIVTDEGGITCHAAIVSRELKKPCVIGTKIATKVLHDGDFVEVDAERGTVKILQNKKK